jgi:WD40 repeat protein
MAVAVVVLALLLTSITGYLGLQVRELHQKQRALHAILDPQADPQGRVQLALREVLSTYAAGREVEPEFREALQTAVKASYIWPRFSVGNPSVQDMAFDHDVLLLATVGGDHVVRVLAGEAGRILWELPAQAEVVERVIFSQNGKLLITVDNTGTGRVWEAPWEAPRNLPFTIRTGMIVVISPDGKSLLTYDNHKVVAWDVATGKDRVLSIGNRTLPKKVRAMAFSQPGDRFATGHDDGTIRLWGRRHKAVLSRKYETIILQGHTGKIQDIAFAVDGELLVSAGEDTVVKIWETEFGNEILTLAGHTAAVTRVVVSPDGRRLATYSTDKKVRVWSIPFSIFSGPVRSFYGHHKGLNRLVFSTDGGLLAAVDGTGHIRLWDLGSGQDTWPGQEKAQFQDIALSRDGMRVATLNKNRVQIWDAKTGKVLQTLVRQGSGLLAAALSRHGNHLATASWDGTGVIWDVTTKQPLFTLSGHAGAVWDVAFNHDGTRLATAGQDAATKVWDVATGKALFTLVGHTKDVRRVVFDASGERIATASWDMTAAVWDANSGKQLSSLTGHTRPVNSVAFNHDGSRLVTAASDGTVKVWDVMNDKELLTYRNHRRSVRDAVFSPSGERIASASTDKAIRIWDTETGKDLTVLSGHEGTVWSVAFSPDGSRVASASEDNTVKLWDVSSTTELRTFSGHDAQVNQVLFAPTGLISVGDDRVLRWWDVVSGKEVAKLAVHPIQSISMHPDGTQVAIATTEKVIIWETKEQRERTLDSTIKGVIKVAYSPDGERLVATSEDGLITVWDAKTGTTLFAFSHPGQAFHALSFSLDGSRLVAAGKHGPLTVFDVAAGKAGTTLPDHLGEILDIGLNPEGKLAAAIGGDSSIYGWQVDSPKLIFKLSSKTQKLSRIAFSPDGQHLAYAGTSVENGTVKLYSVVAWRSPDLDELIALGFSSLADPIYHGAAKALKKDYQGAIEDLQALLKQSPGTLDAGLFREWVRVLEAHKNPFTPKVLLQLVAEKTPVPARD